MAVLVGWNIDHNKSIPVNIVVDVAEGQVGALTAVDTAGICGAGAMPAGVFPRDVDYSEVGGRTELIRGRHAVCIAAAAVSSITTPLTTAADGKVTPCTANNEPIVGFPLTLQATVGGYLVVDLSAMGTYYGV